MRRAARGAGQQHPARAEHGDDAAAAKSAAKPEGTIVIADGHVRLGDRSLAPLRPPHAPGVLTAELRPSYVMDAVQQALAAAAPQRVQLGEGITVGALRSVLASLPQQRVGTITAGPRSVALPLAFAPRGDGARLQVREHGVELFDGARSLARADALRAELFTALPAGLRGRPLAIEIADVRPAADLVAILELAHAAGLPGAILGSEHAPCVEPPAGMSCVAGGFVIVGSDEGEPEERPQRELEISTFYIDQKEITIAQYDRCHAAGACPRRRNGEQKIMQPFVGPQQPMVPLDWERAVRYCAWAGKRLPTEWEWEKAARGPDGDLYPWGNDEPTCERAQYRECAPVGCKPYPGKAHRWDCNEHDTKPVGHFPAGHYGLFEMAGNGYEWTASAGIEDIAACGAACNGRDPQGPCDGAHPCKSTRVLRGGSWYWPAARIRGAHRRVESIRSGDHRLSGRCATDDGVLTAFPPVAIATPRSAAPDPTPPDADALAAFHAIAQDPIEEKPICSETVRESWGPTQSRGGRSEVGCRDPFPYLESNEPRAYLWQRYLANIGGAYLGVGSDQNYSFIAIARSQWAWVMDYDPRVTDHHQRLRVFVLAAATPEEFVALWSGPESKRAVALIEAEFADKPELAKIRRGYWATRDRLHTYYRGQLEPEPKAPGYGWLANPEHYAYVRLLFQQGRIMPIKGDLLGKDSMRTVGEAARKLGVPVRVFYTSNAPSSWGGQITAGYRANVRGLPFDHRTIVLQTMSGGAFRQSGHWHHNVEGGRQMQTRLAREGYQRVMQLLFERIPTDHGDVTVIGLPSNAGD
ncbi:MAG: SUMF1/EgtB/PvdO family nonheme iron enzyme [Nannocystaceae bacterium]